MKSMGNHLSDLLRLDISVCGLQRVEIGAVSRRNSLQRLEIGASSRQNRLQRHDVGASGL
jgi:hypothetical protein